MPSFPSFCRAQTPYWFKSFFLILCHNQLNLSDSYLAFNAWKPKITCCWSVEWFIKDLCLLKHTQSKCQASLIYITKYHTEWTGFVLFSSVFLFGTFKKPSLQPHSVKLYLSAVVPSAAVNISISSLICSQWQWITCQFEGMILTMFSTLCYLLGWEYWLISTMYNWG